jgi:esterase/lipase superfamily enzyme
MGQNLIIPKVITVRMQKGFLAARVAAMAICCVSCAGRPVQGVLVPVTEIAEGTSRVPIFVATTRQRSTTDPGEMFNGERAAEVSYAAIAVSIPPDGSRKVGEVQWPATLPGDPRRDFVTVAADYLDRQAFTASIAAMAKRTGRSDGQAMTDRGSGLSDLGPAATSEK